MRRTAVRRLVISWSWTYGLQASARSFISVHSIDEKGIRRRVRSPTSASRYPWWLKALRIIFWSEAVLNIEVITGCDDWEVCDSWEDSNRAWRPNTWDIVLARWLLVQEGQCLQIYWVFKRLRFKLLVFWTASVRIIASKYGGVNGLDKDCGVDDVLGDEVLNDIVILDRTQGRSDWAFCIFGSNRKSFCSKAWTLGAKPLIAF